MPDQSKKSTLERLLSFFTEVKVGEGVTAVLLASNLFLVLTAYYIAKVVREPLILVSGGAELKSYLAAVMVILLIGAVRLYAWFAGRVPRRRLINTVNVIFAACLGLFYVLAQLQTPYLGVVFFLWVGMFSVMVVAQFWSFANDVYTPEEGKRLFAFVAFGASSGALVGSFLPQQLIEVLGLYQMLIMAGIILLLSLVLTNIVDSREKTKLRKFAAEKEKLIEEPMGKEGAYKLLFNNKYLLMIAFLVLLLNWVNTTGGYILDRTVLENVEQLVPGSEATALSDYDKEQYVGQFYAGFFTLVNLFGMLIQLFFVSRIFRYFGLRVAILILPLIALGGYAMLAFYPILVIVRWAKIAENSTDYSLNNTVRHALFLPTSREEKYKAKQVIDSVFHRSGDVLSALLVAVGTNFLMFETKHFALFNVALVTIWLILAFRIGRANKKLLEQESV